ncbi:hypothetical protein ODU73_000102 [Thermoclostridium stercorarium]|uniref:hypothetical protein n=1 Tax=Thermoclostridium stercorarium TaxID=1510 RepID=UPI0022495DB1|nr:hypothetical protein [Thermoclostridium stercorarium]UZQ85738.1 hypothetical protein ODU73_000102 [Thermoclostridium stercorarium]
MQEARALIENSYGIRINGIKPYRAGYILETNAGRKYIKACQYTKERILFIHQAKTHLIMNDFRNIDPYCLTMNNQPYIEIDDVPYTMVDLIEGRECEFDDDRDVVKATEALALMHKAAHGFHPVGPYIPTGLGKLPALFKKHLEEIRKLKKRPKGNETPLIICSSSILIIFINRALKAWKYFLRRNITSWLRKPGRKA